VESTLGGYFLGANAAVGEMVAVGSILAWIGATPDEPLIAKDLVLEESAASEPTLKALLLLRQYGLSAAGVPASGGRLTAPDVERYLEAHPHPAGAEDVLRQAAEANRRVWTPPRVPGHVAPFTPEERAMARTVEWHRDHAAAGYIEIAYDPAPWDRYAAEFQKAHGLLMNPLLSLISWKLACLAAGRPRINATVSPSGAFIYDCVNLAFTVQAGSSLYLVVVKEAERMSELQFVRTLGELQRAAVKRRVKAEDAADPTISFSSMARWNVVRHIPLLPPNTGLIVGHAAASGATATLGASYDHRLMTGFDVARVLQDLSAPAK
jgi:pyruvate/2-oxoglutarate dehydrogenase complex dihydrolipoamide acyltransferase (E2) component